MKYILIIMAFSLILVGSDKFSIQVISVKKKTSLTDAFMQKVRVTGLSYVEEEREGVHYVYLGQFNSRAEAKVSLVEVREKVSKDAFICERELTPTQPKLKMQQAMLMAQARTLKKMQKAEAKPKEVELKTVEPIKIELPTEKMVITRESTKTIVPMNEDVKTEEIYCTDTKQALRETQIASAIAFYEGSSYYTFAQDKN